MPITESLQLLSDVIDDIEPIGKMTPGVPLRAADWNALVGAVASLARLVASRERTSQAQLDEKYAPADHAHTGEIALSWFEPAARALLEENMSGAVEQRTAATRLRNDLNAMRRELAELQTQVNDIRIQFDGLRDEGSSRAREASRLAVRVEMLSGVEDNLSKLNLRFDGIGTEVARALEFREQLTDPNGDPIDVAAIGGRVSALEEIRANLRTADGSLVNIREFESTLARLEENSVGRSDVDAVILEQLRAGDVLEDAGVVNAVAGQVEAGFEDRFAGLAGQTDQLAGDLAAAIADGAQQAGRITEVESDVQSALTSLSGLSGIVDQVSSHAGRLNQVESRVQVAESSISTLPALRERVTRVESSTNLIDGLSADINALATRMQSVESNVDQIDSIFSELATVQNRIGSLEQDFSRLPSLQTQVATNVKDLQTAVERIGANEAELENLSNLSHQVLELSGNLKNVQTWQRQVEIRLKELDGPPVVVDRLRERMDALESNVAEGNVIIRRLNESVRTIEIEMPALRALPLRLTALDQRLTTAIRGGNNPGIDR